MSTAKPIKPIYSHQVIRLNRELKISWVCPHCNAKHTGFYDIPVLACDMGEYTVNCRKCKKDVLINPRHDKTIYI